MRVRREGCLDRFDHSCHQRWEGIPIVDRPPIGNQRSEAIEGVHLIKSGWPASWIPAGQSRSLNALGLKVGEGGLHRPGDLGNQGKELPEMGTDRGEISDRDVTDR